MIALFDDKAMLGGPITNGLNGVVSNGLGDGQTADIKDLVKDAVKEYFDSMNLPQLASQSYSYSPRQQKPQTLGNPEFRGYNESGEEVWAVVKKDPFAELGLMNTSASKPGSRMMALRQSAPPNSFQRSENQLWNNDGDFQNSLNSWATAAPSHEREIVKNLLKRLNGGQTPAEFANRPSRRAASAIPVEPYQYQCDLSMFSNPPFNPSRHFTINPEWTSERLEVKKIPAAHLHPSATLKNKLGLLRS
ncbi:uncharacterized protein LOC134857019 [Symsagittifera roscoffensis]|uniref:uncharacterized protein LOC134857019 n=1 Tax=Symsagittifera roscoffensis TaxID=84072 RepID=UPI00307BC177